MKTLPHLTSGLVLLFMLGCAEKSKAPIPPDRPRKTKTSNETPKESDGSVEFRSESTSLSFQIPQAWEKQQLSGALLGIHEAKYTVPHTEGAIEVTFSAAGGGAQANIDRWKGQVQPGPGEKHTQSSMTVAGIDGIWVDLRGAYSAGAFGGQPPRENYRVLGVAISTQPRQYFVKLYGPSRAVADVVDQFREVLESAEKH